MEIQKQDLGRVFALATSRIHSTTTELYEELFDDKGSPKVHPGIVANLVAAFRTKIGYELDMIKESVNEFYEQSDRNDKSRQTSLLDDNW